MTQYRMEDLASYEERLAALEARELSPEEQRINRLIIKVVKAFSQTLWLINGGMKWLAAPIGIVLGVWAFGSNVLEYVLEFVRNFSK